MAKKKKKKIKAGILKRKTVKQNRKKQLQQKKTPKTAKPTEKRLQQFLGRVAVYVFTPEIQAITTEEKKLKAIFSQGKNIPDQILEWVDEKIKQEFIEAIQKIQKKLLANQKTEYAGFQFFFLCSDSLNFRCKNINSHPTQELLQPLFCRLGSFGCFLLLQLFFTILFNSFSFQNTCFDFFFLLFCHSLSFG